MKKVHKEYIETLLRHNDVYKDSNGILVADVYLTYLDHLLEGVPEATKSLIRGFLYEADKTISLEAITRAKRKIQELNPELRGRTYRKRKEKAETITHSIHTDSYYEVL